jgi:hypothetical protein
MGNGTQVHIIIEPHDRFPDLLRDGYQITSPTCPSYNCIAWAADCNTIDWWPGYPGWPYHYWPNGTRNDDSEASFVEAFATLGYERCSDDKPEVGYEKVAVYAIGKNVKHMARQLPNGLWSSKLGHWVDIEHTLRGLEGQNYGYVIAILRRKTPRAGCKIS